MQHTDNSNPALGTQSPELSSPPSPGLLDYLLIIARHKKFIFLMTFGAAVISIIIATILPSIFTAKAMVIPSDDEKGVMGAMMAQLGGLASVAGGALSGPTKADLYVTMLRSDTIKDPIIDKFDLMKVYVVDFRADAYKRLDETVDISAGKKDGVVTISVDDKDPKRAAEMANAFVDELGKLTAKLNMAGGGNNRLFFEKRLATAKADLLIAEEALKNFQTRNKTVSVPDQAKATIEGVAALRGQLAVQEVLLDALRRQFTDSSQEVKTTKSSIVSLRKQIAGLEGEGEKSAIPSVGSVPGLGQEYVRLMRDFKVQETLVELLTKQSEFAKLSEAKDVTPFQLLQKAKAPDKKSGPSKRKFVIAFTFVSGLFSTLFVLIKEHFSKLGPSNKRKWAELTSLLAPKSKAHNDGLK